MSWLAQTVPGRISQTPKETGRLFALVARTPELCSLYLTPSPKRRPFVLRGVEDDADHCRAWFTRTRLLQQDMWPAAANGSGAARSAKASFANGLQQKGFHRAPSPRIFPARPRSLARCLSRATSPQRTANVRQDPDSAAHRVLLFPASSPNQVRWVPTPENAPSALGAGHIHHPGAQSAHARGPRYSRRFAQECPEDNPGKSKQEKRSWHFMKTTSR